MLQVGITGGIGSGKTTVCKIFEILNIPIYYADDRAKALMVSNELLIEEIKEAFGQEAYTEEGQLNRPYIANIVFNNQTKLDQLNSIVHPAMYKDGQRWHKSQKDGPYTLKEAAILFESKGHELMDKSILVVAPQTIRMERVLQRDKATKEEVLARMSKQLSDQEKIPLADFIILNDGKAPLVPQILKIHDKLIDINQKILGSKTEVIGR